MAQANPIHQDVMGAPFNIGAMVRVIGSGDETFDERFLDKVGQVEYYEYECGCGQIFPEQPMIGVRFSTGELEEFWEEELIREVYN